VGHSDIAPLRKIDPGEKFPWKKIAYDNIGIWHTLKSSFLKKYRNQKIVEKKEKIKFIKNLRKIGYRFSKKKPIFVKTLNAFQRHFRQELINNFFDKECSIIARNLVKNYKKP